jgi:hypothetical protein
VSAEEAELAAKQAEAARKEKILAAALAQEDAGVFVDFGRAKRREEGVGVAGG